MVELSSLSFTLVHGSPFGRTASHSSSRFVPIHDMNLGLQLLQSSLVLLSGGVAKLLLCTVGQVQAGNAPCQEADANSEPSPGREALICPSWFLVSHGLSENDEVVHTARKTLLQMIFLLLLILHGLGQVQEETLINSLSGCVNKD